MMRRIVNLVLPAHTAHMNFSALVEHMARGWFFLAVLPFIVLMLIDGFTPWKPWQTLSDNDFDLYYMPALGAFWITVFFLRKPARDDGGA